MTRQRLIADRPKESRAVRRRVLSWCGALLPIACGACNPYHLTVEDVLTPIGQEVDLVGKLELRGIVVLNRGLDDRELFFTLAGQEVGTDETNDEGYAHVEVRPEQPGRHLLEVRYHPELDWRATADAWVYVWQENRPIIVVDIDHTVADPSQLSLLRGEDHSKPLPHAADVVSELARSANVVYLTARPREFAPQTRAWLDRHGFPHGPLFTWDADRYEFSSRSYKAKRLDALKDDFEYVGVGIGNVEGDYEAYSKRDLFTILLDPEEPVGLFEGGVRLADWHSIRHFFELNPQLRGRGVSNETPVDWPGGRTPKPPGEDEDD